MLTRAGRRTNLIYPCPNAFYHPVLTLSTASQFCRALMAEVVVIAFVLVILLACYYTSAKTTIPVAQLTTSFSSLPLVQYTAATVTTTPYAYISQSLTAADTAVMNAAKASTITWIYSLDFRYQHSHTPRIYTNTSPTPPLRPQPSSLLTHQCIYNNVDLFVGFQANYTVSSVVTHSLTLLFLLTHQLTLASLLILRYISFSISIPSPPPPLSLPLAHTSHLYITRIILLRHALILRYLSISVSISIYLTGLFGWCGFWIFSFFCGAGLTALPFDMIMVALEYQHMTHSLISIITTHPDISIITTHCLISINTSNPLISINTLSCLLQPSHLTTHHTCLC